MSLWKVYNIQTGRTVKAGFPSEDEAREWLEINKEGQEDNFLYEEMDFDEQDDWHAKAKKAASEADDEAESETEEDDDIEKGRYTYSTDDEDVADDDKDGFMEELDDEEEQSDDSDGSVF